MLGVSLGLLASYFVYNRPSPWLTGGVLGATILVGSLLQRLSRGHADRRGLSLPCRARPIPWSEITGIRAEQGRWLVETTRGTVALPRWLTNSGAVAAGISRQFQAAGALPSRPPADRVRDWLGLGNERRLHVAGGVLVVALHRRAVCLLGGLALLLLGLAELPAGLAILAPIPLLGGAAVIANCLRRATMAVFVDEAVIECDTPAGERGSVPWEAVLAVVESRGFFVLQTADYDIRFATGAPGAEALRRAALAYLAAREAAGGFVAGPGDTSLSPATRLTGDEDRWLSQAETHAE
ncbi:MAG: hypothetical protein HZB16_21530 [Armatimonadetes bacterium]|nr:hypothetical protein [Armatimonadota bacterium]